MVTSVSTLLVTATLCVANVLESDAFTVVGSFPKIRPIRRSSVLAERPKRIEIDVSDLGLTMEDLNAPLPPELLGGIASSGYQSTSRLPDVDDSGCNWSEDSDELDVLLRIPGLRGQPAEALAVEFSKTTCSITAFGKVVWSCLLRGEVLPDSVWFFTDDGADGIPVIQLSVEKANKSRRWGGFLHQVGEDSLL